MRVIVLLIATLFCIRADAQFYSGKRIEKMPANFRYPTQQTKDPSGKTDASAWIVFSDSEGNYTTTTPGGTLVFKKLNFMQPFFVSDEKSGYLRLVKYDPSILKKGSRIGDKRKAVSYGWIPRSKVLMWQKALVDERTRFPYKAVGIISGAGPIMQPKYYFAHDSIIVYNSPELQTPASEKLKLNDLIYIYKFSEDGKKALVGHSSQLTADSAVSLTSGWVSADVVHLWGSRLYVGAGDASSFDEDSAAASYFNTHLKPVSPDGGNFEYDPLLDPGNPVFRSIPVVQRPGLGLHLPYKSAIAENVFDKSSNTVINIKGTRIDYNNYLHLRRFGNHVNVIFVVDGGSAMRDFLPGITNTIQNFEDVFGKKGYASYNYRYGAVIYRGNDGCSQARGMNVFEPSDNFSRVVDFINKQAGITQRCSGTVTDQPYYEGLLEAVKILKRYPMQTNIIIVAGSTGNTSKSGPSEDQLVRGLSDVDARMLVFQVYNKFDPSFNNFVLQSRQILERTAQIEADQKKLRMVKGEGLAVTQQFNTAYTDSVSYYLNYPDGSLIPGAIVFPGRGAVKTNREMMMALNRFLGEVYTDNKQIIKSLDSVFMISGRLKEKINMPVMAAINTGKIALPDNLGEQLPHNAFKYYFDVETKEPLVAKNSLMQYEILLSQDEILQLSDILSRLAGDNLQQDRKDFRKKLVREYISYGRSQWKDLHNKSAIRGMKLPTYLEKVTGMPQELEPFSRYSVNDIKHSMSADDFEKYITYLRKCNEVVKKQLQTADYFISNGKPFFYITQSDWKL
ncbi:type VI secretion system protein TssR domain-containing protein [Chitinophaga sp. Cy-1792]|uniref:type VI secretion system protein TssR domain-containing protein n=1 Tax=Chitinophaga sp. Cy-1792 TaxID=2608339 RepID=UPI00142397EA|nr:type VI secretion system protein TssR domain-containing protein [Chitinophaga sp. Cy-1792]NIG57600.1 hypothetical protein [Chitinophaga sp. Cy-1792]